MAADARDSPQAAVVGAAEPGDVEGDRLADICAAAPARTRAAMARDRAQARGSRRAGGRRAGEAELAATPACPPAPWWITAHRLLG